MVNEMFKKIIHKRPYILTICLIVTLVIISKGGVTRVYAQLPGTLPFTSFLNTFNYGMPFPYQIPLFSPAIRQPPFGAGWPSLGWSRGDFRPAIPLPRPVFRRAATTVSVLITNGPTSAIFIINPTLLYGQTLPTVVLPTAPTLPALFSGKPLIFGSTPITSSNLAIFNFIANNFLLPSGIFFYILP